MNGIGHVTFESFTSDVIDSDVPVVVDFYADWCGPCRMLAPILSKLATEYEGRLKFVKVNIDEEPELARHFSIQSIPTLLSFRDGTPVDRIVGLGSPRELLAAVATLAKDKTPLVEY